MWQLDRDPRSMHWTFCSALGIAAILYAAFADPLDHSGFAGERDEPAKRTAASATFAPSTPYEYGEGNHPSAGGKRAALPGFAGGLAAKLRQPVALAPTMTIRCCLPILFCSLLVASAAASDAAAKKELEKFQGSWTMLSYEDDGKLDEAFKDATQEFKGDAYTVKSGEKLLRKGNLVLDPSQKPAAIDLLPAIGPYKGKRLLGIYVLDGDSLKTCFADPGGERPTRFASDAGSKQSQVVYRRNKP